MSAKTNQLDYAQLRSEPAGANSGIASGDPMQKVFFIFSSINFSSLSNLVAQPYQFYVYSRAESIENIQIMAEHLFITVFAFWMPYLIGASIIYMAICGVIIRYIATNMTKPFIELSERIRLNVKNIQKRKKEDERQSRSGSRKKKVNTIEMQVDLLKGYKQRNRETHNLFQSFSAFAKILYVGHASTQSDFSYQALINLHSVAEMLHSQKNLRGAGTCYMIIGTKLAMQTDDSYLRAI